jgi:spore maturation protein CgeB
MRELLSYDKLTGAVPRMLILESQYWLDAACAHAARQMGWEVRTVPVAAIGVWPREHIGQMLQALCEFHPDFVLTINLSAMDVTGLFARLFEDLRIPYVTWFVDDPRTIIMGRNIYASPYAVALTWEPAYRGYLLEVGFPEVHYMPLAVDATVFNAEPAETWEFPPTFVGNSMAEFAEREWVWLNQHAELAAAMRRAFEEGLVTRKRFAVGLSALLPDELVGRLDEHERRHAELVFFIEGTRRLRRDLIGRLAREGLEVRGDDAWREVVQSAKPAVSYTGALPAFYRACEINVNTTSIQMPTAVNQRVFDGPAAGGFLLTDAQSALQDLFDLRDEVVCYESVEQCAELLQWYRRHPAARHDVVSRARKRILSEHTYLHRLKAIASILQERFAG